MEELANRADVIFTATPQGFCASLVNEGILGRAKIVDLSADFRIKDVSVYEEWYKICLLYTSFAANAEQGRTVSLAGSRKIRAGQARNSL